MMIFTIISNGSVIISAIFERWKEVDNFTFVMFVSLAFNQLFIGFTIFPRKYFTLLFSILILFIFHLIRSRKIESID